MLEAADQAEVQRREVLNSFSLSPHMQLITPRQCNQDPRQVPCIILLTNPGGFGFERNIKKATA